MLPNEPQSKLKRYRFNSKRQKHNNQQAVICVWISGLIIIIFLILGGIKLINQHQSAQTVLHNHVSRHVSKSNQLKRTTNKSNSQNSNQSNNHQFAKFSDNNNHEQPMPPQPSYHRQRFASVNNAKDWARATQQRWLHQGYSDYVVRSDGQGNYYLQYTK